MMLRRNIRESYQASQPNQEQKKQILDSILEGRPDPENIKGKKWRPRGKGGSYLLVALLVAALLAAGVFAAWKLGGIHWLQEKWQSIQQEKQEQEQEQEPSSEPSDPDASGEDSSEPSTELEGDPFLAVIQAYRLAIREDWDFTRCEEENVSPLVMNLNAPGQLGYTVLDLDSDGTDELLVNDGTVIYGLYAVKEGKAAAIFIGYERNSYTLSAYNVIVNVGSNGAASTIYNYYRYSKGNLIGDQQVIFDAARDEENPWFRGIFLDDPDTAQPISEADARKIIDSYPPVEIQNTPISAYPENP